MRLVTIHERDFSLTEDNYDANRATYEDYPHIMAAYKKLWEIMGNDQFIWCFTGIGHNLHEWSVSDARSDKWTLEVPCEKLTFTRDDVWEAILHEFRPENKRDPLCSKSSSVRAVLNRPPDTGSRFDDLIIPSQKVPKNGAKGITALCPLPLHQGWILERVSLEKEYRRVIRF